MSTTRYKIRLWVYDGEASVANAVTFDSFEEAEARFNDLRVSEEMPCVEFIKERIANGCIIGDEVLNVRHLTLSRRTSPRWRASFVPFRS